MGFLDALAAGVPTIVTPQGFHLDVPGGITHPFMGIGELVAVFKSIARELDRRTESVKDLTWAEYARRHETIWQAVLTGRPVASALDVERASSHRSINRSSSLQRLAGDTAFFAGPVVGRVKRMFKGRK